MFDPIARFVAERKGSVATIFAFSLLPMLIIGGAAVDYAGALALKASVQNASDSAILALCQQPTSVTNTQLQSQAQSWVSAVETKVPVTVQPLVVTNSPRQISMTSTATYPSAFGGIVGLSSIPVSGKAQCTAPQPKLFEIALVLDNTGSMSQSSGSTTKIQALQQAATNFVNYVFTNANFDPASRISIVPFSSSVAVTPSTYSGASWVDTTGKSTYHWNNVTNAAAAGFTSRLDIFASLKKVNSSWGWAGCFETLPYPINVQDATPTSTNLNSYYVPMFAPDEPGNGGAVQYPPPPSNPTEVYENSYLNDSTAAANCGLPATEALHESQACKYVSAAGASSQNLGELGYSGPNFGCTAQPLIRLTGSSGKSQLLSEINAMAPAGQTDIHEGVMWGWRTVSPNSVLADGQAYNTKNLQKVIVLMTDGCNTWIGPGTTTCPSLSYTFINTVNKSLYSALGYYTNADGTTPTTAPSRLPSTIPTPTNMTQARAAMDELTKEACANAKAAGVSIYTIGFSVASDPIDQQGISLLQACASSPSQYYAANDSNGLINAFQSIAVGIGALRLSL